MSALPPPPVPPVRSPSSDDKIWNIFCHLSLLLGVGLVLPLVVYLVKKDDAQSTVAAHAREALNFHISFIIYSFICLPLFFVLIGIPLLMVLGVGGVILSILATIKASEGQLYYYPLILRLVP